MKKSKQILALILAGVVILPSIFGVWLNVIVKASDDIYTVQQDTLNRIAAGTKSTGYITGGRIYVSYGNETIGINNGGGVNYFNGRYINLPLGQHAIDVEKGLFHTLVLTKEGKVFSLGDNEYGQLGNGTYSDSEEFIDLSQYFNNEKVVQISANGYHSLALTESGKLYGWGYNRYYQVSPSYDETINIPTITHTFNEKIRVIEAGGYSSFVLTVNGELFGWGFNGYGNLGTYDIERKRIPEKVGIYEFVESISSGKQHTMAITRTGKLYMWGRNDFHQIDDSDNEFYHIPQHITKYFITGMDVIDANINSSCVSNSMGITIWGENSQPEDISAILETENDYINYEEFEISLGSQYAVFLTNNNKIYTCGNNSNGQTATGIRGNDSEFQNVTNKFIVKNPKIYERKSETIKVSPDNKSEDLYDIGINNDYYNPEVSFHSLDDVNIIVDINGNIEYIKENITTEIYAIWKENEFLICNDIKNPVYNDCIIEYKVISFSDKEISAGRNHTMYLDFKDKLIGWGANNYGQIGIEKTNTMQTPISVYLNNNEEIISVKCGYNHTVILTKSGKVYTFGLNDYGQLGDGTTINKNYPVLISGFDSPVVRIEAAARQTYVITEKGSVYAWGANNYGQLGDGTKKIKTSPVNITGKFNNEVVENIISGHYSAYALTESGKVFSWGYGSKGNLGDGTKISKTTPVEITNNFNGEKVYKIDAGAYHAVALTYSNNAYVWGYNDKNQLGLTDEIITFPIKINSEEIIDVFTDESNIGYLTQNGITMLGDNSYNQLGTGITNLSDLTFGQKHSALVGTDGKIYVSGGNNYGQLGLTDVDTISEYIDISDKIDITKSTGKTECGIVISNLVGNKFNVYITANNISNINEKIFKITYNPQKMTLEDGCVMTTKKETTPQKIPNSYLNILSVSNGEICFKYELDTTKKVCGWINGITFKSNKNSVKEINLELITEDE